MTTKTENFVQQEREGRRMLIVTTERLKAALRRSGTPFHETADGLVIDLENPTVERARHFMDAYGYASISAFDFVKILSEDEARAILGKYEDAYPGIGAIPHPPEIIVMRALVRWSAGMRFNAQGTMTGRTQCKTPNVTYIGRRAYVGGLPIQGPSSEITLPRDTTMRKIFERVYGAEWVPNMLCAEVRCTNAWQEAQTALRALATWSASKLRAAR